LAWRFLGFGALAWGGPVAQIATLHRELVEREQWVDEARFRKVLAVYQALPGPEATELCIWFGTIVRGRVGGLVAGLGFLMPGFALMLLASWLLLELDPWPPLLLAAFAGLQAAIVAVVARAAWRLFRASTRGSPVLVGIVVAVTVIATMWAPFGTPGATSAVGNGEPGGAALLWTGLRAGLLTFGGAYSVIPLLRADACGLHGWMTPAQFTSGLAVGGALPAPMVILGTWVGWAGGGLLGALVVTVGIFAPAFAFPLLLHDPLERLTQNRRVHALLDAVTAAVIGLVVAVAAQLATTLNGPVKLAIAGGALLLLAGWHSRFAVLPVLLAAATVGVVWL
jgi:chromate transporter